MPPRTLSSLAHALAIAADLDGVLIALSEALAEIDRAARVALFRIDARHALIRDKLEVDAGSVQREPVETTLDHLPGIVRAVVEMGVEFAEVYGDATEVGRLLHLELSDGGLLALRGVRFDGALVAMLSVSEPKRIFGQRALERFLPAVSLFELGYARLAEQEAKLDAFRTLEELTQRLHDEYERKLATLQAQLEASRQPEAPPNLAAQLIELERAVASGLEELRRTKRRADAVDHQAGLGTEQLAQAHIELHRRSEGLRQKTRTLYLIERVLSLDATTEDARALADGLLALVGEDLKSERCSLLLRTPEGSELFLAAARGVAPFVREGLRVPMGTGIAGGVAQRREPLLVRDMEEARDHPLLQDEYFTTGSFISFPLLYHDQLVGVVNVANRARRGIFLDEDVDRMRVLAMIIAGIAAHARLSERLLEPVDGR